MTAEDRCKVYKDLFKWAENKENEITYLEEGMYAARVSPEWEDYSIDFWKCPECGYLLNKYCPQCYNKVIIPKGGEEE